MNEPDRTQRDGRGGEAPPSTQEEVIASAFAHLARMLEVARRAADRGMQGDGPFAETARDVRDAARGAVDSVRRRLDGPGGAVRRDEGNARED